MLCIEVRAAGQQCQFRLHFGVEIAARSNNQGVDTINPHLDIKSQLDEKYMYSFQWTVKVKKPVGKLPVGAWVEIVKTTTTLKPSMLEIFKAFEKKYGVRVPNVSDQYFYIRKDF